jgi:hypothetical protein
VEATSPNARSTAYPQPEAGKAKAPGPLAVPAEQLRQMLGLRAVNYEEGTHPLVVSDTMLANS